MEDTIQNCMGTTIPSALANLQQSQRNIEQIAQYCRNAYSNENEQGAVFQKTQSYIKDALSNVAYHIHTVGLHLTNFLQLQVNEIDKLDLQIQTLKSRMKAAHDNTGASGFKTQEAIRDYRRQPKIRKLQDHELPVSAQPLQKIVRQNINLKALDNVGIDLSGNKGSGSFVNLTQPPSSIQAPPPSLGAPPTGMTGMNMTASGNYGRGPPPPPPSMAFRPPPPPISMDMPPPPPPAFGGYGSHDDMLPPPPPPLDDMPPPPPPRGM